MAVVGGGFGVVQDGLVRDADIKDVLQDEGGLSGADGEGDVEGQDESQDILGVVNSSDVDERFERARMNKFCRLKQEFAVHVAEFELGRFYFLQDFLRWVKPVEGVKPVGAVVVAAFVHNDVQESFPAEQGMLAVRTEVLGFEGSLRTVIGLKDGRTDFAAQL